MSVIYLQSSQCIKLSLIIFFLLIIVAELCCIDGYEVRLPKELLSSKGNKILDDVFSVELFTEIWGEILSPDERNSLKSLLPSTTFNSSTENGKEEEVDVFGCVGPFLRGELKRFGKCQLSSLKEKLINGDCTKYY
jgi:hypothetical protein